MNDDKKDLGIVIGQLRFLTDEFHDLKRDVKTLIAWRWRLYGTNAVISIVCSGLFALLVAFIERR